MAYDIAIIGAGPAGCTLARLLNRKYNILMLDKRDLSGENNTADAKSCGGLLAPDAQKMLGRMGMAVPTSVLVDPQIFLVRTIDFDNHMERFYQRFYFNMDRLAFDQWLLSGIPEHVDLALGCCLKSCGRVNDGVQFAFSYNGKMYAEKAKVIIGADGAHSIVRKEMFPDKSMPANYIAIQEWFETETPVPYYGAVFDKTITDFYSWTITKKNVLIIGSALKKDNLASDRFKMLKMRLRDNGLVYGKKIKREGSFIMRPKRLSSVFTGDDNSALTGEAAGFISPSSAEGISYALKSGYYLAAALNDGLEGFQRRYMKMASELRGNLFLKNLKSPAMYSPLLRSIILKTGIKSTQML